MSDAALGTGAFSGPIGNAEPATAKRGPLLITALLAASGGTAIYLAPLAAVWRMSWPYGLRFLALGAAQLGTGAGVLARPVPRPADAVEPSNLPAGQRSTVEYCRPAGMPLAMDLYMPSPAARPGRPMPVAVYIHGGGTILGDRKTTGLGATLANHEGALFPPLRRQLNARGFVVASIGYRMPPGAPWPASIQDAKCAVRFLRAHSAALGIDADRIGAWGGSGGGQLASLLGLAGPGAGFDDGQYLDQSSTVQAVVDMFGPADLNDFDDAPPFIRLCLAIGVGDSAETRRAMSPNTYVTANAPPFLVLHGDRDEDVFPRHSFGFAKRLRAAGVPTTLIEVHGTGHTLDTPGQRPSPRQLTDTVTAFLVNTLG